MYSGISALALIVRTQDVVHASCASPAPRPVSLSPAGGLRAAQEPSARAAIASPLIGDD